MLATNNQALAEYARNVGHYARNIDSQWLLTDWDVWVRNPHYKGPSQPHPEDDSWAYSTGEDLSDAEFAAACEDAITGAYDPNYIGGEYDGDMPY